jgi:hypothetical protein
VAPRPQAAGWCRASRARAASGRPRFQPPPGAHQAGDAARSRRLRVHRAVPCQRATPGQVACEGRRRAANCGPRAAGAPQRRRRRWHEDLNSALARLRRGSGSSRSRHPNRRLQNCDRRPATSRDQACAASVRPAAARSDGRSRIRCRRTARRTPDRARWPGGRESWPSVRCRRCQLRATADLSGPAAIPMSYRLLLPRLMRRLCPMCSGPIMLHAQA